jgi:hypothetical protein
VPSAPYPVGSVETAKWRSLFVSPRPVDEVVMEPWVVAALVVVVVAFLVVMFKQMPRDGERR